MTDTVRRVGYIGMGIMGSAMASNLIRAGYEVTVWNRTASRCETLRAMGAAVAASPRTMAQQRPDVICLNVTDTADVEAVLFGHDGVLAGASEGLIVVDHSTINPVATQGFAKRLAQRGVAFVDAPVSGGDVGARAGTLSIMVGGEAAVVERLRPMLGAVGKRITHVGPAGMGQACKACNQVAVVNTLVGVCEALALAGSLGLDQATMIEVVSAGAGGSWQLTHLGPQIAAGDFEPGFMIDLVLKDLGIVLDAAEAGGIDLAGAAHARALFEQVAQQGGGRQGTQAMMKAVGMGNAE